MLAQSPQISPPRRPDAPVRAAFARAALIGAAAVVAVALGLSAGSGQPLPVTAALALALGGYLVGVGLAWALLDRGFAHPTLGLCNRVTLARPAIAAGLLAGLAVPPPPMAGWPAAMAAFPVSARGSTWRWIPRWR